MRKPVKVTGKAFEDILLKRKKKVISVDKQIPSGSWATFCNAWADFSEANSVSSEKITIKKNWGRSYLHCTRLETDAEFRRRVRRAEDCKYDDKLRQYKRSLTPKPAYVGPYNDYNYRNRCCSSCTCGCC